jgi:DNA-directed RNA polymerase subunit H (RpoH/RPB5)
MAFSFGASGVWNIEVLPVKKIDDFEYVPGPEIVKEEGEYKIIRKISLTETQLKLDEDDPIVPIPKD